MFLYWGRGVIAFLDIWAFIELVLSVTQGVFATKVHSAQFRLTPNWMRVWRGRARHRPLLRLQRALPGTELMAWIWLCSAPGDDGTMAQWQDGMQPAALSLPSPPPPKHNNGSSRFGRWSSPLDLPKAERHPYGCGDVTRAQGYKVWVLSLHKLRWARLVGFLFPVGIEY